MQAAAPSSSWTLLGAPRFLPGFVHGLHYPSLLVGVTGTPLDAAQRHALERRLAALDPTLAIPPAPAAANTAASDWAATATWLLEWLCRLQQACGQPVYDSSRIVSLGTNQVLGVVPCQQSAGNALLPLFKAIVPWIAQHPGEAAASDDALRQSLAQLQATSPSASNTPRFIQTAHRLNIPFRELPGSIIQYGVGSRSRWLESTFTDQTGVLSAQLARNKVWSQALLRRAGVPVPQHQAVANADTAVKVARALGYPVVVKPADQDGGLAVAAGLVSDDEVRTSFEAAREHSRNILVEKHVPGRDYRLTVFQDQLLWAVEREPGGVTGDGVQTVEALLAELNADPRRGEGPHAPLKELVFNDEARTLLSRLGLTLRSIPPKGTFVRLRRAANVASGGMPIAVFDRVHPDNAQLAVRAARVFGLDFAGIDMLIPDIAVSWKTSGAYLCEINSQPSLGQATAAHLYEPLLHRMLDGDGRIPTILVLGAARPSSWTQALSSALAARGLRVGVADADGVRVEAEHLQSDASAYAAGEMLTLHRGVDAMVIAVQDTDLLRTGLPVARYDALVVAGRQIQMPKGDEAPGRTLTTLLKLLVAGCDGEIFLPQDSGLTLAQDKLNTAAKWSTLPAGLRGAATVAQRAWELRNP